MTLNEKMLRFAGFTRADIKQHYHYEELERLYPTKLYRYNRKRVADWLTPGGVSCTCPPDFPKDETACFKWIIRLC